MTCAGLLRLTKVTFLYLLIFDVSINLFSVNQGLKGIAFDCGTKQTMPKSYHVISFEHKFNPFRLESGDTTEIRHCSGKDLCNYIENSASSKISVHIHVALSFIVVIMN